MSRPQRPSGTTAALVLATATAGAGGITAELCSPIATSVLQHRWGPRAANIDPSTVDPAKARALPQFARLPTVKKNRRKGNNTQLIIDLSGLDGLDSQPCPSEPSTAPLQGRGIDLASLRIMGEHEVFVVTESVGTVARSHQRLRRRRQALMAQIGPTTHHLRRPTPARTPHSRSLSTSMANPAKNNHRVSLAPAPGSPSTASRTTWDVPASPPQPPIRRLSIYGLRDVLRLSFQPPFAGSLSTASRTSCWDERGGFRDRV